MAEYYLSNHVHACKLDGVAVFLDLRANQYLSVPPQCMPEVDGRVHGFEALGPSAPAPEIANDVPSETLSSLVSRGILTASPRGGRPVSPISIKMSRGFTAGQRKQCRTSISAVDLARFSVALSYSRISLRLNRVEQIINRLLALRVNAAAAHQPLFDDSCASVMQAFRRLRTYVYTAKDACLTDSLVLAFFLYQYGYCPRFVIGVRGHPFQAHAWVQLEDCVVDDRIEYLQRFTPILSA